jgi:spermidine synthase
MLERELKDRSQGFDLMILDAFNSDSIPEHLLTKEALAIYFKHLADDGTIAVHVSNQYLDLSSMVCALGDEFGLEPIPLKTLAYAPRGAAASEWVVLSQSTEVRELFQADPRPSERRRPAAWTDDAHSLFEILR